MCIRDSITQAQVCKIGVWVIFCFRASQQVINGHFINLCQRDKGMLADVLKIVRFITTQSRFREMCLLCKLLQCQAALYTQVFQSFLYG